MADPAPPPPTFEAPADVFTALGRAYCSGHTKEAFDAVLDHGLRSFGSDLINSPQQVTGCLLDEARDEGQAPPRTLLTYLAPLTPRLDLVRAVLDRGADPNVLNLWDTNTPLNHAVRHIDSDRVPFIRLLLAYGADPCLGRDRSGYSPLTRAVVMGCADSLKLLVDHAPAPAVTPAVDALDLNGLGPLHYAASRGHLVIVRLLLDRGADPSLAGRRGTTPLLYATAGRQDAPPLGLRHSLSHSPEFVAIARLLLARGGCDPNRPDDTGMATLHNVLRRLPWPGLPNSEVELQKWQDMLKMLLVFGADPFRQHQGGRSANTIATDNSSLVGFQWSVPQQLAASLFAATRGWPPIHIAAAVRSPVDGAMALASGHIDTARCSLPKLLEISASPSPLERPSDVVPVCPTTVTFVRRAMARWSPSTHPLFHRRFRDRIRTVLLLFARHGLTDAFAANASAKARMPALEQETVRHICSFLLRRDWQVRAS